MKDNNNIEAQMSARDKGIALLNKAKTPRGTEEMFAEGIRLLASSGSLGQREIKQFIKNTAFQNALIRHCLMEHSKLPGCTEESRADLAQMLVSENAIMTRDDVRRSIKVDLIKFAHQARSVSAVFTQLSFGHMVRAMAVDRFELSILKPDDMALLRSEDRKKVQAFRDDFFALKGMPIALKVQMDKMLDRSEKARDEVVRRVCYALSNSIFFCKKKSEFDHEIKRSFDFLDDVVFNELAEDALNLLETEVPDHRHHPFIEDMIHERGLFKENDQQATFGARM